VLSDAGETGDHGDGNDEHTPDKLTIPAMGISPGIGQAFNDKGLGELQIEAKDA